LISQSVGKSNVLITASIHENRVPHEVLVVIIGLRLIECHLVIIQWHSKWLLIQIEILILIPVVVVDWIGSWLHAELIFLWHLRSYNVRLIRFLFQ
jgi:hypothetical protein